MLKKYLFVLFTFLLFPVVTYAQDSFNAEKLEANASPAIVRIYSKSCVTFKSTNTFDYCLSTLGDGTYISADGYILTNTDIADHSIDDELSAMFSTPLGAKFYAQSIYPLLQNTTPINEHTIINNLINELEFRNTAVKDSIGLIREKKMSYIQTSSDTFVESDKVAFKFDSGNNLTNGADQIDVISETTTQMLKVGDVHNIPVILKVETSEHPTMRLDNRRYKQDSVYYSVGMLSVHGDALSSQLDGFSISKLTGGVFLDAINGFTGSLIDYNNSNVSGRLFLTNPSGNLVGVVGTYTLDQKSGPFYYSYDYILDLEKNNEIISTISSVDNIWRNAMRLYFEKDYNTAAQLIDQVLKIYPNHKLAATYKIKASSQSEVPFTEKTNDQSLLLLRQFVSRDITAEQVPLILWGMIEVITTFIIFLVIIRGIFKRKNNDKGGSRSIDAVPPVKIPLVSTSTGQVASAPANTQTPKVDVTTAPSQDTAQSKARGTQVTSSSTPMQPLVSSDTSTGQVASAPANTQTPKVDVTTAPRQETTQSKTRGTQITSSSTPMQPASDVKPVSSISNAKENIKDRGITLNDSDSTIKVEENLQVSNSSDILEKGTPVPPVVIPGAFTDQVVSAPANTQTPKVDVTTAPSQDTAQSKARGTQVTSSSTPMQPLVSSDTSTGQVASAPANTQTPKVDVTTAPRQETTQSKTRGTQITSSSTPMQPASDVKPVSSISNAKENIKDRGITPNGSDSTIKVEENLQVSNSSDILGKGIPVPPVVSSGTSTDQVVSTPANTKVPKVDVTTAPRQETTQSKARGTQVASSSTPMQPLVSSDTSTGQVASAPANTQTPKVDVTTAPRQETTQSKTRGTQITSSSTPMQPASDVKPVSLTSNIKNTEKRVNLNSSKGHTSHTSFKNTSLEQPKLVNLAKLSGSSPDQSKSADLGNNNVTNKNTDNILSDKVEKNDRSKSAVSNNSDDKLAKLAGNSSKSGGEDKPSEELPEWLQPV